MLYRSYRLTDVFRPVTRQVGRQSFSWLFLFTLMFSLCGGLLFLTPASSTHAAPQQYHEDGQENTVPFGVHSGFEYVDMVKQDARFQELDGQPTLTRDDNGWPQSDFEYIFIDMRRNMPWNGPDFNGVHVDIAGTYHLIFTGQATLTVPLIDRAGGLEFQHVVYKAETNTTTADVVVHPNAWLLAIGFTQTRRQAGDTAGNGVTNIHLIRPGYPANTKQVFTDRYLNALKLLRPSTFRSFDTGINSYNIWNGTDLVTAKWADRALPTDAYWPLPSKNSANKRGLGIPWEYYIQVCNAIGADPWINLPVSADDDYITQLANLLKNGNQWTAPLRKDLHVYLEYTNEAWNFGFSQAIYINIQAQQNGLSNFQQYVKRTVEISQLFGQVYGAEAINTRIRPLVVWQYNNQVNTQNTLLWAQDFFHAPINTAIWGIGEAPYLDPQERGRAAYPDPSDPKGVDRVIDTMYTAAGDKRKVFMQWQALAAFFGLHQVGYEAGPSLNAGLEADVSRNPRLADLIPQYFLDDYFAAGGEAVNFFAFGQGTPSNWGDWYTFEDYNKLFHPRYVGALLTSGRPRPAISVGFVLPWKVGETAIIDASQHVADSWQSMNQPGTSGITCPNGCWPHPGHLDYLLRTSATGTYEITLRGHADATLALDVAVDNVSLGTVTLPTSDGASTALSVSLKPGQHGLVITPSGSGTATLVAGGGIEVKLVQGSGSALKPSAPLNLFSKVNDGQATLHWENVTTATSYTIKRGSHSGGPYFTVGTSATNSFTDTGLSNGKTYYYVVTASNEAGTSINSPQLPVTPTLPVAPVQPTNVVGASGGVDWTFVSPGGQARINWPAVPNATSYTIKRSTSASGPFDTVTTQTGTIYYDRDLNVGTTYYFTVTASNSFGDSPASDVITLTPQISIPDSPTGLQVQGGNGSVALKWQPSLWQLPSFAFLYHIKRASTPAGPFTTVLDISTDNAVDLGLSNGTTYCYIVTASNSAGESAASTPQCTTPHR